MKSVVRYLLLGSLLFAGAACLWRGAEMLSQKWLVDRLTQDAASDSTLRARHALEELVKLDRAALPTLVAAAHAQRAEVALVAQKRIDEMLNCWVESYQARPFGFDLASGLQELALRLDQQTTAQAVAGGAWARGLAERLLQIAEHIPAGERGTVVLSCELVLEKTESVLIAAALGRESALIPQAPTQPLALGTSQKVSSTQSIASFYDTTEPLQDVATENQLLKTTAEPSIPDKTFESWNPTWTPPHRVEQELAATSDPLPAPTQEKSFIPLTSLKSLSTREIFRLWIWQQALLPASKGLPQFSLRVVQASIINQELASRGFGSPRKALIMAACSRKMNDRLTLVEHCLTSAVPNPTQWLLLMAEDPAPRVRREALVALITSRQRSLLEAAHEIAIRDSDPEVAKLATEIQSMLR